MELKEAPWKIYLDETAPTDPVARFSAHVEDCRAFLARIPADKIGFRYAPEKWSVKELVGHITDADLIFLYRLICIARGETKSLSGFDENAYVRGGRFDSADWGAQLRGHRSVSEAALALILGLDTQAWNRRGTANDTELTPLDMLRVWIGHERHHLRILRERYALA